MKRRFIAYRMFTFCIVFICSIVLAPASFAQKPSPPTGKYIQLRVYHAADTQQLGVIDRYLQFSLVPELDKKGFRKTGVFKAIDSDTAKDKKMYVVLSLESLTQLEQLGSITDNVMRDSMTSPAYTRAAYNGAPYSRIETILLRAFASFPEVRASGLTNPQAERVYELRSYESATEALHQNKVQMFDAGETALFHKLGFNAVFYGKVIAGSRMPNLMYMTSFENKAARDEHWKAFGNSPEWKAMSSRPEYQNNVSKIEVVFLRPVSYSKL